MHTNFLQNIRKLVDLSEGEAILLNNQTTTHQLKKKEHLLLEGKICKQMFFVEKGCSTTHKYPTVWRQKYKYLKK